MITPIFPNYFFSVLKPPNISQILETIENSKLHQNQEFSWHGKDDGRNINVERLEEIAISKIMEPVFNHFLRGLNCKPCSVSVIDIWKCTYLKGGYQEIHCHKPSTLSVVVFLDDHEEDFGCFSFQNSESRLLPDSLIKLIDIQSGCPVLGNRGDILIFPSHMYHLVSRHQSDKPRRTVAMNVNLNAL